LYPIKVLFCIDNLVRGGTELQLIGLIDHLDRTKFKPYLLTIRKTDPDLIPKDCVHLEWSISKLVSLDGVASIIRLAFWMRREHIDVVQAYFQDATVVGGVAGWLARVPQRIACFRDMAFWGSSAKSKLMSKIYRLMTCFVCNAHAVKGRFITLFDLPVDKFVVIPNGVNSSDFRFVSHPHAVTDVGIVGNMTRQVKRTDLFIDAASIVLKTYPAIRFHIIGDGQLRVELETQVEQLGIGEQVIFTGRIADVSAYLEQLQVGVVCSDSEGLSNALIEYMFRGVACVATDVGGNPELISNNLTGVLVPPDDALRLAEGIELLIADVRKRETIVQNARNFVEREYSWEQCMAAHGAIYES
jgi:L-malate glycosyltransferase